MPEWFLVWGQNVTLILIINLLFWKYSINWFIYSWLLVEIKREIGWFNKLAISGTHLMALLSIGNSLFLIIVLGNVVNLFQDTTLASYSIVLYPICTSKRCNPLKLSINSLCHEYWNLENSLLKSPLIRAFYFIISYLNHINSIHLLIPI